MDKNYFNDPRPPREKVKLQCCSCRSDAEIDLAYYPWGMQGVRYCPVCGSEGDNIQLLKVEH